jgi:hypothetical protein
MCSIIINGRRWITIDKFFELDHCDRCGGGLKTRIMSWFNHDTLCMKCHNKETELKGVLGGEKSSSLEGCGYIPKVDVKK